MIINIDELRNEFDILKKIRLEIIDYFNILSNKIELLTGIYSKYIKQQENVGVVLFGLDAFHFQTFLINFEYDSVKKMHILIENKLYCEYYKLFKLMINYIKSSIDEQDILKMCENKSKYPVYKDLEQYRVYDFELINNIHEDILLTIDLMNKFVIKKEKELEIDENNSLNGLNLHIVVNTIDFNITSLKQKIKLYVNYLKAFHKYHTTYLTRLSIKIGLMCGQINKDIKIEQNFSQTTEMKTNIKSYPSLTDLQQQELNSLIETENKIIKDELNDILVNISDESDSDREKIDEKKNIIDYSENLFKNEKYKTNQLTETNNETNINILFINNNKVVEYMESKSENDVGDDVGSLTSNDLKEKWMLALNQNQMINEDIDANKFIVNPNKINTIKMCNNSESESESEVEVGNEQEELNKWREIINNTDMTQEEKSKEKARLKRIRYKANKKKHKTEVL